jgi:hypothetical protein
MRAAAVAYLGARAPRRELASVFPKEAKAAVATAAFVVSGARVKSGDVVYGDDRGPECRVGSVRVAG